MTGEKGAAAADGASPLLETKLYVPGSRRGLVARPRLVERLNRGAEARLTLVSAPAGFGKTTLLAEWLAAAPAAGRSAAWLSLDQGDNHPATFWTYLVAALQTAAPGVGASALSLLRSPRPPPIEALLAPLLNELSAVPTDLVLVLDDYHVVEAREVHDGVAFLLNHLPRRLHLVIASRADPLLPLAGLRARGELVEVRAADLRFESDEAAAYLNGVMGLKLRARDVAALEERTEGGSPGSSSQRSRCRGGTTRPPSSPASPGTTATSSTTLPRRSCSASPSRSGAFCCGPPSWTG